MQQGATPRHTFNIPFDTSNVAEARVLYSQNGKLRIVKKDVEMSGSTISVKLTQEDTLCLNPNFETEIQLRILSHGGDSLVSDIFTVETKRCLSKEVL